jgi:hypothetical protein
LLPHPKSNQLTIEIKLQLEERMRQKMSHSSRRELLNRVVPRYCISTWKEKGLILDEFVSGAGYNRKYAVTILNQGIQDRVLRKRMPPRRYDEDVRLALITVWKAANRICSRRLMPFLPDFVAALERFGHLSLPTEVRKSLLAMSPATADRLLYHERHPAGSTISTTRPGKLLKHQIPVRTFFDWNDLAPGYVEVDLVAHCGECVEGAYLNTLTLTDIATGWTECLALLRRSESNVGAAIHAVRQHLPFPLLGLDTDNGGEFINYDLLHYCEKEKITFTRSRAYRKNDQAHVEEKNGSVVRRLVGYDRYEGMDAWRALTALYEVLRLYVNFFQPSVKLLSKERKEGRTTKHYDKAQTPYQRTLSSSAVGEDQKSRLRDSYQRLDPVVILKELERLQDQFWKYAHQKASSSTSSGSECEMVRQNLDPPMPIVLPPACNPETLPTVRKPVRTYRRTKKPSVPRTWRTRIDPFADVWEQIQLQLEIDPSRTGKELFLDLQQRYPGKFPEGQLRTLQRRIQQRCREKLHSKQSPHGAMPPFQSEGAKS